MSVEPGPNVELNMPSLQEMNLKANTPGPVSATTMPGNASFS